jgi:ribosome modulation factor
MTQTRRDNVEYHKGASDFLAGVKRGQCPYTSSIHPDSRSARWYLGWDNALAEAHAGDRMARDYTGKLCPMPEVKGGEMIATYAEGMIELWKQGRRFAVVYGLQIKEGLPRLEAGAELAACLFHSLDCEGKLD